MLSQGFSGWTVLRTLHWDLPPTVRFVRELIAKKRAEPADDLLTDLIHAEKAGDRVSEDELPSLVFLLIIAGHETTVHLITNGVLTLLQHPEQLARLRAEPGLMESAVEEILRYRGPVHGTKPGYAREDLALHEVTILRGTPVVPLLGSANHDPAAFERPEVFDVARSPNRHLGFGHGIHFCLGAPLARMETHRARPLARTQPEAAPRHGSRCAAPPEDSALASLREPARRAGVADGDVRQLVNS